MLKKSALSNTHPAFLGSTEPRVNASCNNFVLRPGVRTYSGNQSWKVWAENDLTTFQRMHHFSWFLISSSSFDALADKFYLHGQEHRTSGYQSLCNCGDYREDIQDVSLTIPISLKAFLKSSWFGSWFPFHAPFRKRFRSVLSLTTSANRAPTKTLLGRRFPKPSRIGNWKDLLVINIPGAVLVYSLILLFELHEIILASLKLK